MSDAADRLSPLSSLLSPVLVIGAGAAGLVAAWRAASLGAEVWLLEKNARLGTKILISGGGKCNVTHDGPVEKVLGAFRQNEARFLRPSVYRFTNADVVNLLEARGIALQARPDGRVFPTEGNAKDVVAALEQCVREAGVKVKLEARVTGIRAEEGRVAGVELGEGFLPAERVILAVGGCSYPGTGTTGDGWPWAKQLGHTVRKVRAALAPIFLEPTPPAEWSGVALRDAVLHGRQAGKEIARERGDVLFTHRGVSGPAVLAISRVLAELREKGPIMLEADLVPDTPHEALTARLKVWTGQHPRRTLPGFVDEFVPSRLTAPVLAAAGVAPATTGAYLSRPDRNRLVNTLKGWPLGNVQQIPMEKGEVVAGGVALEEVDPKTMASRVVHGLYLCGEVLDIAGPVGGYNLQAAFSTGYVAGECAAKA